MLVFYTNSVLIELWMFWPHFFLFLVCIFGCFWSGRLCCTSLFMFCSSRLLFVSCFSFLAFSFATVHKWSSWCFLQYCYLSWWYLLYRNFDHGSELLSDLLVSMLGKLSLLHLIIWIFWKLWCSWNKNLWVCPLWKIIFKDARIICLI